MEENVPRSAPTKGKRKNISQVPEQSQDHDIFNDQPSSKKLKVLKPTNSSNIKRKTDSWPQSFYDINAFLTKVFF